MVYPHYHIMRQVQPIPFCSVQIYLHSVKSQQQLPRGALNCISQGKDPTILERRPPGIRRNEKKTMIAAISSASCEIISQTAVKFKNKTRSKTCILLFGGGHC